MEKQFYDFRRVKLKIESSVLFSSLFVYKRVNKINFKETISILNVNFYDSAIGSKWG